MNICTILTKASHIPKTSTSKTSKTLHCNQHSIRKFDNNHPSYISHSKTTMDLPFMCFGCACLAASQASNKSTRVVAIHDHIPDHAQITQRMLFSWFYPISHNISL